MFEFLNILTVIDKEYLLNIKKKKEEKIVKRFFIIYSIDFTFTCLLIIITNCVPFILLLFIFYFSLFMLSPIDGYLDYPERRKILFKNKYFKLSIVFSIIFAIFIILLYKFFI